jgi:hypothetical protein
LAWVGEGFLPARLEMHKDESGGGLPSKKKSILKWTGRTQMKRIFWDLSMAVFGRVWIDAPRWLGLGCAPLLAEIHGLLIKNSEACGINPEIGHPGFLRSRGRAR